MRKLIIVCTEADAKTIRDAIAGSYRDFHDLPYVEEVKAKAASGNGSYAHRYVGGMRSKPVAGRDLIKAIMAGKKRFFSMRDLEEIGKSEFRFAKASVRQQLYNSVNHYKTVRLVGPDKYEWIDA